MNNKKTKTIAFYIGSLAKGGAERVMVNLAEYFYSQGYRVFLVTKLKEQDEYPCTEGITRIIADLTKQEERGRIRNFYNRISKLKKVWKEIKPDLIVSFIRKNNLMALASAHSLKIPVYVSVRSDPARELKGKLMKYLSFFMFHGAAGIILQTTQAKDFFPKALQKKAVILPNSLNPMFISAILQEEQNIEMSRRIKEIVQVGRIDSNKNQRMLITVFDKIAEAYPDWKVRLYGDGEDRQKLEEYADTLSCRKQIFFMGQQTDIQEKIKNASVFVLTSRAEGMPNALMEAMTLGLAVIATDCPCGGPRDLIHDHENGILIPVDDEGALKKALTDLMNDEEYRIKLGKEAKKIVTVLHPDRVNREWKEYLMSGIES